MWGKKKKMEIMICALWFVNREAWITFQHHLYFYSIIFFDMFRFNGLEIYKDFRWGKPGCY